MEHTNGDARKGRPAVPNILTNAEQGAAQERCEKATKGPMVCEEGNFVAIPNGGRVVAEVPCQGANDADVPFIAFAFTDLPRALDTLTEADGLVAELAKESCRYYACSNCPENAGTQIKICPPCRARAYLERRKA